MGSTCALGRSDTGSRMIEVMVPDDHLLRRVDRLIDLNELRTLLVSRYSARGRPSVNPELLIRMALVGRIPQPARTLINRWSIVLERRSCGYPHAQITGRPSHDDRDPHKVAPVHRPTHGSPDRCCFRLRNQ